VNLIVIFGVADFSVLSVIYRMCLDEDQRFSVSCTRPQISRPHVHPRRKSSRSEQLDVTAQDWVRAELRPCTPNNT